MPFLVPYFMNVMYVCMYTYVVAHLVMDALMHVGLLKLSFGTSELIIVILGKCLIACAHFLFLFFESDVFSLGLFALTSKLGLCSSLKS